MRAADAIARGEDDVVTYKQDISQLEGKQRSSAAANNVVVDQGSALDVLIDTETTALLNIETIEDNASWEAWNHKLAAVNDMAAATMSTAAANGRRTASILDGASSAANRYNASKSISYAKPKTYESDSRRMKVPVANT